mgnify:FL=1
MQVSTLQLIIRSFKLLAVVSVLTGCGGGGGGSSAANFGDNISTPVTNTPTDGVLRPSVANSVYSADIVNCVKIVNDDPVTSCKLSVLPFIGQHNNLPTKADILAKTVVSHPWMTTRFSQVLDQMPKDIFLLFRGVTAVVIAADIRPSHYRSDTGAIYLDPAD